MSFSNAFTVDVEEYFQVEAFSEYIPKNDWEKYPSRVEGQVNSMLCILDAFQVKATFFILGWVAERHPALIQKIQECGHEIASHGYDHGMITRMEPDEFRRDIRKSKEILERISGSTVVGYRAPTFSIRSNTSWAYDILLEEGYRYSSSVYPIWHDRYGWPDFGYQPRRMGSDEGREIWELPMAVGTIGLLRIPFGGGGYFRIYPLFLTKTFFRNLSEQGRHGIFYIHPWEIDAGLPVIRTPFLKRLRHYFGIQETERKLTTLLHSMKFGSITQVFDFLNHRNNTPS
jgi:polysaccharide deacetylase family protein (PEP-CTERM system associated)